MAGNSAEALVGSEPRKTLRVAVTGDTGVDVYTNYIPGCILGEQQFYREIAYDLEVPNGAEFLFRGLQRLLPNRDKFKIGDHFDVKQPTLPKSLEFLKLFSCGQRNTDGRVLRIGRAAPFKLPEVVAATDFEFKKLTQPLHCVVIHDATKKWREDPRVAAHVESFYLLLPWPSRTPSVFVNLGERVPDFVLDQNDAPHIGTSPTPVWTLLNKFRDSVAIVCSATSLRHSGAAISRRLSVEQFIEDTIEELQASTCIFS